MLERKPAEYDAIIGRIAEEIGRRLPPDTPVQYKGGYIYGWEDKGYQMVMVVDAGDCKLSCVILGMGTGDVFKIGDERDPDGICLMGESTLGDRESYGKYTRMAASGTV